MFDNVHAIYLLWDPVDGKIRYVGRSKRPERRLAGHREGHSDGTRCAEWEGRLVKLGLCPRCAIVETGLDREEANERERWWMGIGLKRGWPLTNMKLELIGEDGPWREALGEHCRELMLREWRETEQLATWWETEIARRWYGGNLGAQERDEHERGMSEDERRIERLLDEYDRLGFAM